MSNSPLNKESNNEVDLFQLFDFFQNKFKGLFILIFRVLKFAFDVIISFLKILQKNFTKISIIVITAFVLGFVYDMNKPRVYSSKMIVKPLFDSKYQLVTNIRYYNELVGNGKLNKLSEIFELNEEEAKSLSGFVVKDGPESEKGKTRLYNSFMKSLDSAAAATVNYEKFVEDITIYDASLYEIEVKSSKNDIFGKLSNGFKKTFVSDDYSKENKRKKDTLFKLKKASINKSLKDIDSLKKVYISELSKSKNQTVELLGSSALKMADEQKKTKEYELLQLQIAEQNKLTDLEEDAIKENQLFEVVSDFQLVGSVESYLFNKMKFVLPFGSFIIILLWIIGVKFNKFVASYNTTD